jgi:hypothetical protein
LAAVNKAKAEKKAALEGFKAAVKRLIDLRVRYAAFKVRRSREGWLRYGKALKLMGETESVLFKELKVACQGFRKTGAVSPQKMDEVEGAILQTQTETVVPLVVPPAPAEAAPEPAVEPPPESDVEPQIVAEQPPPDEGEPGEFHEKNPFD